MEASVAEYTEQKLQEERKKLKKLMTKCTSQTAIICQRSMEQYDAKLLEKKKMIQQKNLVKIQSYIRGMMARKVFKEQKKIYTLAAIFIQQNIRKHQRIVQARKERKRQFHNVFGHFFRYAMRINRTFIFLSARIDEIDANTNTFEVNLRLFHPLTDTVATLQVKATDLEWIKKKLSCQQVDQERVTRCAIINELVYHHLTLFRSQKHGILVLGLVKTHLI
jgi:hypothetical protein